MARIRDKAKLRHDGNGKTGTQVVAMYDLRDQLAIVKRVLVHGRITQRTTAQSIR